MADYDYAATAASAAKLIAKFGGEGRLTTKTGGAYDPATGAVTGGSEITVPVTCCVFSYDDKAIDGTRILTGDRKVIVAAGAVPKVDDTFTWQGETFRVITTKQLAPAGVNVITQMQVRK